MLICRKPVREACPPCRSLRGISGPGQKRLFPAMYRKAAWKQELSCFQATDYTRFHF